METTKKCFNNLCKETTKLLEVKEVTNLLPLFYIQIRGKNFIRKVITSHKRNYTTNHCSQIVL